MPSRIRPDRLASTREPILDGIRGVAIVLVLGAHLPRSDGTGLISNGWMGVDLFFVLSGYLITKLLPCVSTSLKQRSREITEQQPRSLRSARDSIRSGQADLSSSSAAG